jgi:hypothetical protein
MSAARPWLKRRDRWLARVTQLDNELHELVIEFQQCLYPVLRAGRRLPKGYSRDTAKLFDAIERVQQLAIQNPILSCAFTTRGHQRQPYLKDAIQAMRILGITKADSEDLLTWVGVKQDSLAFPPPATR